MNTKYNNHKKLMSYDSTSKIDPPSKLNSRAFRLEKGSKNYRKSLDFNNSDLRFSDLKEDGYKSTKYLAPLKHDPLINPMPFNNQNPYMIESRALTKKDPLIKEYGLPRVNS